MSVCRGQGVSEAAPKNRQQNIRRCHILHDQNVFKIGPISKVHEVSKMARPCAATRCAGYSPRPWGRYPPLHVSYSGNHGTQKTQEKSTTDKNKNTREIYHSQKNNQRSTGDIDHSYKNTREIDHNAAERRAAATNKQELQQTFRHLDNEIA